MKTISDEQLKEFKKFIENHEHFYIAGHKEPDGDCIASCLGVAEILKHFKKEYKLVNAGPFKRVEIKKYADLFTDHLDFLLDEEIKKTGLIICDCSELKRLGEIEGPLADFDTFILDHHKTAECPENSKFIIDSTAPAASLMVQSIYEKLAGPLTKEISDILFFGTMTDTGFFRFLSEKDFDTVTAISRMIAAGSNPRETYDYITSGKSFASRKLLGIMLDHAEKFLDGKLIVTYETMEDTKKWGQEGRDTDTLYSSLLSIEGVEAVVFLRQETETNCTGGLRSKDKIDVSIVASKFGGGGHKNASGMSTDGKLNTLIPAVVKEFSKIM